MPTQPSLNRRQFEARLIARAWKDPRFAEELRRDPRGVIARELAAARVASGPRPGLEIKVVEETPTTRYLVVPAKPQGAGELSQAELARIRGGGPQNDTYAPDGPGDGVGDALDSALPPGPGNSTPY
jgi:hypothetical protein